MHRIGLLKRLLGREDEPDAQALLARGHAEMAAAGASAGPFRLVVADVFTIQRRGTVVTGTVERGSVSTGTQVEVQRAGRVVARAELTGIEVFRETVRTAAEGQTVGLLLPSLGRDDVRPGDVVAT